MDRKTLALGALLLLVAVVASNVRGQGASASPRDSAPRTLVGVLPAAWTSISGLRKNGASGSISGGDACAADRPVASVGVPADAGYVQMGGTPFAFLGGGTPLIDTTFGHSPADVAANVAVDWRRIVEPRPAGGGAGGDGPLTAMPAGSWFATNRLAYPTVILEGDLGPDLVATVATSGRGVLVVRGDLILRGFVHWQGLLLVGGNLTIQGRANIEGAVVTGLNTKIGTRVPVNVIGNGNTQVAYNSCEVRRAVDAMERALAPR